MTDVTHDSANELRALLECPLCLALLCSPATTPCGHTMCRPCLVAAYKEKQACAICRFPFRVTGGVRGLKVSVTLEKLLVDMFPDEYVKRKREMVDEVLERRTTVPIFEDGVSFPGQHAMFQFFEPRYIALAQFCTDTASPFLILSRRAVDAMTLHRNGSSLEEAHNATVQPPNAPPLLNDNSQDRYAGYIGVLCDISNHVRTADGRFLCKTKTSRRVEVVSSSVDETNGGLTMAVVKELEGLNEDEVEDAETEALRHALEEEVVQLLQTLVNVALVTRIRNLTRQALPVIPKPPADCEDVGLWIAPYILAPELLLFKWLQSNHSIARLQEQKALLQRHIAVSEKWWRVSVAIFVTLVASFVAFVVV